MENNNYRLQRGSVERIDRHKVHQSVIRKQMIDYAKSNIEKKKEINQYTTPESSTVNSVEVTAQNVGLYTVESSKEYIKKQIQKRNEKKKLYRSGQSTDTNLLEKRTFIKRKTMDIKNPSFFRIRKSTSNEAMKKYVVNKRIKDVANKSTMKFKAIKDSAIKVANVVKRVAVNPIVSLGGAGLISMILVLSLFMGCFSVLAYEETVVPSVMNVSEEVLAYRDTIERYCERYNIEEYVTVIMAIMMQESGGQGTDPMQCSESGYNTRYSHQPNSITDPEYSIEVGVKTFANCLEQAGVESPNDTDRLKLALQGYNYGNGYIAWALTNFGGYTKSNAQAFSDMMKERLGTSGYGDPDYVDHVLRYISFGFGDLRSSPNFSNSAAWGSNNPFSGGWQGVLQCTYFAWGRFYEVYGYDSGARTDGKNNVNEIVAAHPDKFRYSTTPAAGSVYSCSQGNYAYSSAGHVGFVVAWDGQNITVQDGNVSIAGATTLTINGLTLTWAEQTMTWSEFQWRFPNGLCFAVPK